MCQFQIPTLILNFLFPFFKALDFLGNSRKLFITSSRWNNFGQNYLYKIPASILFKYSVSVFKNQPMKPSFWDLATRLSCNYIRLFRKLFSTVWKAFVFARFHCMRSLLSFHSEKILKRSAVFLTMLYSRLTFR